jgi:hypothetical protein
MVGSGNGFQIVYVVTATLGFITGATISGFSLHHPTIVISMPYGRILSALGACLVVAHFAHWEYPLLDIAIASVV